MNYPADDVSAEGLLGTVWRRKKDGTLVRITGGNNAFDDCTYVTVVPKGVQSYRATSIPTTCGAFTSS